MLPSSTSAAELFPTLALDSWFVVNSSSPRIELIQQVSIRKWNPVGTSLHQSSWKSFELELGGADNYALESQLVKCADLTSLRSREFIQSGNLL